MNSEEFERARQLNRSKLESYNLLTIAFDIKISARPTSTCSNCSFLHGKILSYEEALQSDILPHRDCNQEVCAAVFLARPIYGDDGLSLKREDV